MNHPGSERHALHGLAKISGLPGRQDLIINPREAACAAPSQRAAIPGSKEH